jgi:hypothetical protein
MLFLHLHCCNFEGGFPLRNKDACLSDYMCPLSGHYNERLLRGVKHSFICDIRRILFQFHSCLPKPEQRSRYSDWLRAGRLRGRNSSPGTVKNFLFSTSFRPALGFTHPPIQWVPGVLSPGVKRPGREADHSPPTSAEVKKMCIYTSSFIYACMVYCLFL